MSRAIHKMRTFRPKILIKDFGNVNSTPGFSATFSIDVGTGNDRTIIVLASFKDLDSVTEISTCTVDGNSVTRRIEIAEGDGAASSAVAIFSKNLTTESGVVNIVITATTSGHSFGLSVLVLTAMNSATPTDTASKAAENATSAATTTTLDGQSGGIAVGIFINEDRSTTATWGSSLTERADLLTGSTSDDHRHSAAYDLLPSGRSASTETVTWSGAQDAALCVASFK